MSHRLQNEIEHGRHLVQQGAGQIWNWESPAGQLCWKRRVQLLTNHLLPGMNVLELGCGTGFLTRELAVAGAQVTAIDISPELLEAARSNCSAANVTFEVQNAYALSYPDESFDLVVGSSILHHLDIGEALRQIYRVLRPGGRMCFTEPNMLNPQIAVQKNVPSIKKRLGDSPDETAFVRWPLRRQLERIGFRDVQIEPFDFLHPKTPSRWIPTVQNLANRLERLPLLREIAGSLHIRAVKMNDDVALQGNCYREDRAVTLRNRAKLNANHNLLHWYRELYRAQFANLSDLDRLRILEIGSGVSPLTEFYPSVITSDVLDLDYLDFVFDCHRIDEFEPLANSSLDVITLTNVLHHLKSPIEFLTKAASKLKPGGKIIATEEYFSTFSTLIYKYLHHEPVDFSIDKSELAEVRGPLSSANGALPWLIFERPDWRQEVERNFDFDRKDFLPFTALSYFVTGGISHRIPLPNAIYRTFFNFDLWLSRTFPRLFAAFFTITLTRR